MSRRVPPNEAQPVVQRIRLRYTKSGRMRFASHRDFQRALERAVRRGGVPVALSGGFSPHPRISYANAAPTGAASDAEYVELGLAEHRAPDDVAAAITSGLPTGFAICAAAAATEEPLAGMLVASQWRVELPGIPAARIRDAVAAMRAGPPVHVSRLTKSGRRDVAVSGNWLAEDVADGRIDVVVSHDAPAVRPEDIVTALALPETAAGRCVPRYTRLQQGRLAGTPPRVVAAFGP